MFPHLCFHGDGLLGKSDESTRLGSTRTTGCHKSVGYVYDGGGNWAFNTAYAASAGLEAKVVRLKSLADAEQWIAHRVPVIASIAYGKRGTAREPDPLFQRASAGDSRF